ncbi:MAG: butyrate kinase, partial [Oscillospiraceae bacterium]
IIDAIPDDAGPFSPERSGSVPLSYIVEMCYSGEYNRREMIRKLRGMGGLKAYLGTYDMREIERMVDEGNPLATSLFEAEAYQIAKGIGEMAPVLCGKIDAIILTGGMAYSRRLIEGVERLISFLGPVRICPGEDELESLALGALRILRGEETASVFEASAH